MIRSSACLSANDLSIVCRVRKSPYTTNPKFNDAMEMTCTMRHWCPERPVSVPRRRPSHKSSVSFSSVDGGGQRHHHYSEEETEAIRHAGPELVLMARELTPVGSSRTKSPGLQNVRITPMGASESQQPPKPIYIPLSEILVVEAIHASKKQRYHAMRITTQGLGFFVFDNLNNNSRDVLLAFLRANLASAKIVETKEETKSKENNNNTTMNNNNTSSHCRNRRKKPDDISIPSATSVSSSHSMDVDKLTSERMKRCSERESLTEKVTRRTSRLAILLSELCVTISDTACCRGRSPILTDDDDIKDKNNNLSHNTAIPRELPTPTAHIHMPSGLTAPAPSTNIDTPAGAVSTTSRKSIELRTGDLEEESTASSRNSPTATPSLYNMGSLQKPPKSRSMIRNGTAGASAAMLSTSCAKPVLMEKTTSQRERLRDTLRVNQLPSGLSVEGDPASEDYEEEQQHQYPIAVR